MCRPLHFYHKVTLRASAPQNTLWETPLGGCQGKAGGVESTLAKKLLLYWTNRSVLSRLEITGMESVPSQGTLNSHSYPPNFSLLLGHHSWNPTVPVLVQELPHRPARPSSTETFLPVPPQFSSLATAERHEPRSQSDSNWLTMDFRV